MIGYVSVLSRSVEDNSHYKIKLIMFITMSSQVLMYFYIEDLYHHCDSERMAVYIYFRI